eukprot:20721-Heterococcus_DN1.PRE.5
MFSNAYPNSSIPGSLSRFIVAISAGVMYARALPNSWTMHNITQSAHTHKSKVLNQMQRASAVKHSTLGSCEVALHVVLRYLQLRQPFACHSWNMRCIDVLHGGA